MLAAASSPGQRENERDERQRGRRAGEGREEGARDGDEADEEAPAGRGRRRTAAGLGRSASCSVASAMRTRRRTRKVELGRARDPARTEQGGGNAGMRGRRGAANLRIWPEMARTKATWGLLGARPLGWPCLLEVVQTCCWSEAS